MKKILVSLMIAVLAVPFFAQSGNRGVSFLRSHRFWCDWHNIEFRDDGTYSYTGPNDPNYGTYTISGNTLTMYQYVCPMDPSKKKYDKIRLVDGSTITLPLTFEICPDEEDLFHTGCIKTGNVKIWSDSEETSQGVFKYQGHDVRKYPAGKNKKYVYVLENTKMRDAPSLKSNVVKMHYLPSHHDYDYFKERHVVYAGEIIPIIGATDFEEEIGDAKARWYLIYEDDKTADMDTHYEYVWIFGGWVKEISSSEYDYYNEKAKGLLKESEPGWK